MCLQIDYPEIAEGIMPRHRFMSAYEQRIEPPDRRWQYLLMAAEPYETIAFKVVWPLGSSCERDRDALQRLTGNPLSTLGLLGCRKPSPLGSASVTPIVPMKKWGPQCGLKYLNQ